MTLAEYREEIQRLIDEDWELVKDTAGLVADRHTIFDMAFRYGWYAARKHKQVTTDDEGNRQ